MPSYVGLRVDILERADGELMLRYQGEAVDFQEGLPPSSALWARIAVAPQVWSFRRILVRRSTHLSTQMEKPEDLVSPMPGRRPRHAPELSQGSSVYLSALGAIMARCVGPESVGTALARHVQTAGS